MNGDMADVASACGNMITAIRIPNPLKMERGNAKGSLEMLWTGVENQTSPTDKVHSVMNTFDRGLWNDTAFSLLWDSCIKSPPSLCASKDWPIGHLEFSAAVCISQNSCLQYRVVQKKFRLSDILHIKSKKFLAKVQ